jgi:hypothetical protein
MNTALQPNRPRNGWQFGLRWLAVFFAVIGLGLAWYRYGSEPLGRLRLHVERDGVRLNGWRTSWESLPQAPRERSRRMVVEGQISQQLNRYHFDPFADVDVTADEDATFADFKRAIELVWIEAQAREMNSLCVFHIRSAHGECTVFPDYLRAKKSPAALSAHITADNHGGIENVTSICPHHRVSKQVSWRNKCYTQLHSEAAAVAGVFDPVLPGTMCCILPCASLWCDDHLKFCHVADALEAISVYRAVSGNSIPLIQTVLLLPLDDAEAALAAMIDPSPVLELPPRSVDENP